MMKTGNRGTYEGAEKLSLWFNLSYASFAVIPRVLMEAMPDEWQGKMADILKEYDDAFPNMPPYGTRVYLTDDSNKLIKTPGWLVNYRHPDEGAIDELRRRLGKDHGA
jgi:hypothetical protein